MAGCVPCFIIPLLLFIFHRYIQPIVLKFWNPWEKSGIKSGIKEKGETENCTFSCDCSWNKKLKDEKTTQEMDNSKKDC